MKAYQILLFLLCFYIAACADKKTSHNTDKNTIDTSSAQISAVVNDSFETGKVINNIVCKSDASQSYALYLPSEYKNDALPVIYFFDPHADGGLPLKKYKTLADEYGFILIGSNNSKNGNDWPATENIWNSLLNDTKSRLNLNVNRIYTCGFSGGAKVAGYIALHHAEIKSVIANGAGLPDETPAGNFNFSFTAIAGKSDMNMTDLVALNNAFDKTQTRHRMILFDGKHEWAPENTMHIAFEGLQLDAMHNKLISKNDSLINAYIDQSKKRFNDNLKANDFLQAVNECNLSINMLNELSDAVYFFKQKEAYLINTAAYKNQLQQEQNLFNTEQNKKAEYQQQFQQGNLQYWTLAINDVQTKANLQTAEGAMYQRLLAYLSLAFYSIINNLINNNQNEAAQYFVTLYKLADATNSEAWYFSAILNARNNNTKAAEDDLLKAAGYGFNDVNRMIQQPEFQRLSSPVNFEKIKSNMKKE